MRLIIIIYLKYHRKKQSSSGNKSGKRETMMMIFSQSSSIEGFTIQLRSTVLVRFMIPIGNQANCDNFIFLFRNINTSGLETFHILSLSTSAILVIAVVVLIIVSLPVLVVFVLAVMTVTLASTALFKIWNERFNNRIGIVYTELKISFHLLELIHLPWFMNELGRYVL
mmetsp:Transcript_4977/g.5285  ORF Transcript_4977/g.5285 Transcript_4977/m.5285 type:complete len:169 (-) Transcript_4977:1638-2144(-)